MPGSGEVVCWARLARGSRNDKPAHGGTEPGVGQKSFPSFRGSISGVEVGKRGVTGKPAEMRPGHVGDANRLPRASRRWHSRPR